MKQWAAAAIGIWLLAAGYFGYLGVTTQPWENDSLKYHFPIAYAILDGTIWNGKNFILPFSYYPGIGEAILAVFMVLKLPLNLYNWAAWIILFLVCRALGRRRGLGNETADIFAAVICLLPTTMRLFTTQLVDIWMAVWWGWLMYLLEKPEKKISWWVELGLAAGLLLGTKFNGIILLLMIIVGYGKELIANGNLKRAVTSAILIFGLGGMWYVRNWVVKGNPLYPLDFGIWKGEPASQLPIVWKTILWFGGGKILIGAFISEFLIWAGVWLMPIRIRNKWTMLGLANLLAFALLPGGTDTILSNCRYLIPGLMMLIPEAFRAVRRIKKEEVLAGAAVLGMAAGLPQLEYKPKLMALIIFLWTGYKYKFQRSNKDQ